MPVASIIILTYNNLEYTRLCLESIYSKTDQPSFEVILVDNASQDGTAKYIQEFSEKHTNVRVILNSQNEGFARANNQGAEVATGDNLIFLNNDTVVTQGWLSGLIRHLDDERVGMVGPVTNASGNETCIQVSYKDLDDLDNFAEQYIRSHASVTFEIEVLPFLCVGLRRKVFEEIGPLDERFAVGMFEDDDYAIRLRKQGYKLLCIEDAFVHHWGSAAFGNFSQSAYRHIFVENLRKFEEKWGIKWQPHLFRPELLRTQMRQMIDDAAWMAFQNEELHAENAALRAELDEIHSSRAWSLVQWLWKLRIWIAPAGSVRARLVGGLIRIVWSVLATIANGLEWLNKKLTRPMISWSAFTFYRYLQARQKSYGLDFSTVHCLGEPALVSVILPVYNGADYVAEAIDSILQQTYTHFELIVVDDGSTDDTPKIVEAYARADSRLLVIHQENQRLPAALNAGHQQAHGEYITWISADNRLKFDFLEKMVDCLHRHPEWDMAYANIDLIDENGKPLRDSNWYKGYQNPPNSEHIALPDDLLELNVEANNYIGAAFLYRSKVPALIGDYSRLRFGMEDYDYWMRINALLTLRHVDFPESVYEYRFQPFSLTSQDESLGITLRREGLMVYEDARRDFYLAPLLWYVEAGDDLHTQELANQLKNRIRGAHHKLSDQSFIYPADDETICIPQVYVRICGETLEIPDFLEVSPKAHKVLILLNAPEMPAKVVSDAWDLCILISGSASLPFIPECLSRKVWLIIPDIKTLFNAIDIHAKSRYLSLLEEEIERHHSPLCKISVVVCTYRRGQSLKDVLTSLGQQTFPANDFEVIVVNNDPDDPLPASVIEELRSNVFVDRPDQLRLIVQPLPGLSFARNAGIIASHGEVVSFIDDDASAPPNWLDQVWQTFREFPQAGVVGGSILLRCPDETPRWLKPGWKHYWGEYTPQFEKATAVDTWRLFPWGGNWSARREALMRIGGFRTAYGRRGSDFSGGEELVAASLIQRLGYLVVVAPSAGVFHHPDDQRFTFNHVQKTIFSSLLSHYQQQIDMYIPTKPSLHSLAHLRNVALAKALLGSFPFHQRIDHILHAWGYQRVINQYRIDQQLMKKIYRKQAARLTETSLA